jgi:hypothetical protein
VKRYGPSVIIGNTISLEISLLKTGIDVKTKHADEITETVEITEEVDEEQEIQDEV